jgi:hypothetical protein
MTQDKRPPRAPWDSIGVLGDLASCLGKLDSAKVEIR